MRDPLTTDWDTISYNIHGKNDDLLSIVLSLDTSASSVLMCTLIRYRVWSSSMNGEDKSQNQKEELEERCPGIDLEE